MRIVYKGNYIRMTCGEIGLVVLIFRRKRLESFCLKSMGKFQLGISIFDQ